MIITVTMNPAIDKTAELDTFVHEGLNRLQNPISDVGGKGINVSKTIHALGGESIATGFLAGNNGKMIQETLRIQGIKTDFLFVEGETRVNLKVIEPGGVLTELNEPGPTISKEIVEELIQKLESYATPRKSICPSGKCSKGSENRCIWGDDSANQGKGCESISRCGW